MASSGSTRKQVGRHWYLRLEWRQTAQSVSNNTTTVESKLYWGTNGYGATSGQARSGYITTNGSRENISYTSALSANQEKLLGTSSTVVSHNSDGTKSITISASADINLTLAGTYFGAETLSLTAGLNTIARGATVTSLSFTNTTYDRTTMNITTSKPVEIIQYQIDTGPWVNANNGIVISGLSPGFSYKIRAYVAVNGVGAYSGYVWVSTPALPQVTGFSVSNVMMDRATINYGYTGSGVIYQQVSVNDTAWTDIRSGDIIDGLVAGTSNTVQIRVSPSTYTSWTHSGRVTFSTVGVTTASVYSGSIHDTFMVKLHKGNPAVTHDLRFYAFGDDGSSRLFKTVYDVPDTEHFTFTSEEKNIVLSHRRIGKTAAFYVNTTSKWNGIQGNINSSFATLTLDGYEPTISSPTYRDINSKAITLTGNNQQIVQNQSELRIQGSEIRARGYSTLHSYNVKAGDKSVTYNYSTETFIPSPYTDLGHIDVGSDTIATLTVVDSRGFTTSKSLNITIVPWVAPNIMSGTATRLNGFEDTSYISFQTEYYYIVENRVSSKYRIRELPYGTWSGFIAISTTSSVVYGPKTFKTIIDDFPIGAKTNEKSFEIQIHSEDYFGVNSISVKLDSGSGLVVIDKDGWAFQERVRGVSNSGSLSELSTQDDLTRVVTVPIGNGTYNTGARITNLSLGPTVGRSFCTVSNQHIAINEPGYYIVSAHVWFSIGTKSNSARVFFNLRYAGTSTQAIHYLHPMEDFKSIDFAPRLVSLGIHDTVYLDLNDVSGISTGITINSGTGLTDASYITIEKVR